MRKSKRVGGLYTISNRHNHNVDYQSKGGEFKRGKLPHGSLVVPLEPDENGVARVLLHTGEVVLIPLSRIGPKARA